MTDKLGTTTYNDYDGDNNVLKVTYPNGVETDIAYVLNRVTALATQQSGYTYQRGPTGNLTHATELNGRNVTWSFDGIYRLTNEQITGDPGSQNNGSLDYGLDPVGNRTSADSTVSGLAPVSGSYNADDELSGETYDQDGNVTAADGKTFTYDSQNELVTMNGGAVQVMYDGDGNRVAKSVNGVVTRYLVDDLNPTGLPQVMDEMNGSDVVTRTYTYGLQRISEDQLVSGTWTPSFYSYDGMGSVRQLTSMTGAVTDSYEYDDFGNKISHTGTTPNAYMYRGEAYDSDLGLYYLRARWMNPLTDRFMSRDPEKGQIWNPITLHKYLYAASNPAKWIDPTGRDITEYSLVLESRSLSTVEYANTINCYINILFTGASTVLSENLDGWNFLGAGGAVYGCLTISWDPATKLAQAAKTGLDLGACAASGASTIHDLNEYLTDPTAVNEAKFVADDIGSVLGCGLTGIAAAIGP